MEVILLERIEKLGQMGDVVKVKDGYARNFLLPRSKALRATQANRTKFEAERGQLEARNLEQRSEAEKLLDKVDGESYVILRQAGETGQLYGSVSTRDIAQAVSEGGVSITRNQVNLDKPIKALGLHETRVSLHPEVSATVTINVARTEDEAERQARGEDVTIETDDLDDDALDVEEVFEDAELARQAEQELDEEPTPDDDGEAGVEAAGEAAEKAADDTEAALDDGDDGDDDGDDKTA